MGRAQNRRKLKISKSYKQSKLDSINQVSGNIKPIMLVLLGIVIVIAVAVIMSLV